MDWNHVALERDGWRCARDGAPIAGGSVHHRQLRSQGGADSPENRGALCGSGTTGCHGWAHHNREAAAREGWIVSGAVDPAAIPVWHWLWQGWVLLLPDGNVRIVGPPPGGDARNAACQPVG